MSTQMAVAGRLALRMALLLAAIGLSWNRSAAQEENSTVTERPRWTNARLIGTPGPMPDYSVQRVYAKVDLPAPLYVAPVPGTSELLVVLTGGDPGKPSRVVAVDTDGESPQARTVLELQRRLIYGLTFHPQFAENREIFVFSNGPWGDPDRQNRISRFRCASGKPFSVDASTEQIILQWNSAGHDGGDLAFGTDGMLYISSGDGTSDSDQLNSGQDLSNLLAAVLRIDVDRGTADQPYTVPPDNPFLHLPGARPEIWAYGFRNPWRMDIDPRTGDVWVGNNGQDQWETAHLVRSGDNCGWSVFEGSHPFYPHRQRGPTPVVAPTIEHPHSEFRSLTGGVVYYGQRFPELQGAYIYGDYSTGKIWGARHRDGKLTWWKELADTSLQIAAFGVDQHGDLLIVDHGGGLFRLVPQPARQVPDAFPRRLSDTGLFSSVAEHQPAPGVIPYAVNAEAWADGATAERLLALPGDEAIDYTSSRGWNFPNGTVLVQTLSIDIGQDSGQRRRVETRLLVRHQNEWAGYSYRWNDQQTDALLVGDRGEEFPVPGGDRQSGNTSTFNWRIPSRTECLTCHSRAANFVLGLTELQANRLFEYGSGRENQLRVWSRWDMFTRPLPKSPDELGRLVDPYDTSQPLDLRARSYLHANCSQCHVEAGGGNSQMDLEFTSDAQRMKLIGARPQHDSFGLPNAMLLAPGNPDASVLLYRVGRRGPGQMPPLASQAVDQRALEMLGQWIAAMRPPRPVVRHWQWEELAAGLDGFSTTERDARRGERLYGELGCRDCHRMGGRGGVVGPDLQGVGRRLGTAGVLEAIVVPSKTIADGYASTLVETQDGRVVTGLVENEDHSVVVLRTGPGGAQREVIDKRDIVERSLSGQSNMPAGIINVLEREEIWDLLAYVAGESDSSDAIQEGS